MSKRQVFQSVLTREGWRVRKAKQTVSSHPNQKECESAAVKLARGAFEAATSTGSIIPPSMRLAEMTRSKAP